MQIKYKSITVFIKSKKELLTLNMFPKNKQNKLRQTNKNDIKERSCSIIQP